MRLYNLDDFRSGLAGGHDVLDDRHTLARTQRETAAQGRHACFFLNEDIAHAQVARDDVPGQNPTDCGRHDDLRLVWPQQVSKRCAHGFRGWRILKYPKFLDEAVAVQTARQAKMTTEQGTALMQQSKQLV